MKTSSRATFIAATAALVAAPPAALAATAGALLTIEMGTGPVTRVRFSPDGRLIVASSSSGVANVYTATGSHVARLAGQRAPMFSANFDRTSTRIVTTGYDGTIVIWSTGGRRLKHLQARDAAVTDAFFTPRGDDLVVSCDDGTTSRLTLDGHIVWSIERPGVARCLALSHDGTLVASTSDSGLLSLIGIDGREDARIATGQTRLNAIGFNPVRPELVSGGRDGTAIVWTFEGERIATIGHRGGPWANGVAFDRSGGLICVAGEEGALRVASTGGQARPARDASSVALTAVACAKEREMAIVGDASGTLRTFLIG